MPPPEQNLLHGRWLHAYEEDEPGRMVYRPASHPLPPARGRTGYEFEAGGQVTRIGPGSTDRTQLTSGRWSIDQQGRVAISTPGAPDELLDVIELTGDRMVVKP